MCIARRLSWSSSMPGEPRCVCISHAVTAWAIDAARKLNSEESIGVPLLGYLGLALMDRSPKAYRHCRAGLHAEELEYRADEGPEGWVPLRIVSPARAPGAAAQLRPLPVVIFLHATGLHTAT